MKFADYSLNFNVVPEWKDQYLAYDSLKETVYHLLAKVENGKLQKLEAEEIFLAKLKKEVERVEEFYVSQNDQASFDYNALAEELRKGQGVEMESSDETGKSGEEGYDEEKELDSLNAVCRVNSAISQPLMLHASLLMTDFANVENERAVISCKKKIIDVFINISELKLFVELNKIGFSKITKKFDKNVRTVTREPFMEYLETETTAFGSETMASLDDKVDSLYSAYANISHQTLEETKNEFKVYLREQIIMERSVVWKGLLELENNNFKVTKEHPGSHGAKHWEVPIFGKTVKISKWFTSLHCFKIVFCIVGTFVLLFVKTLNDRVQGRALALLACCAWLWATEAIPLFVTSLLVPLLVVLFKVLKNADGSTMGGEAASKVILGTMWSSVIMLLLGGFTLAAALSKYNIAKFLSLYILYFSGTNPRMVLLAIMGISMFLSMWISNVAAPVLCYSLIQPILRLIPTELPIATALVLGIALASNAGGMASPISLPQNVIAIELMNPNPGWGKWFAVAIPVCFFELIFIWLMLVFTFNFKGQRIRSVKPSKERFNFTQWFVIFVSVGTIILWCVLTRMQNVFGESGIILLISMVLFFGLGILTINDLKDYPWNIIVLAQGGLALGNAITLSGLLKTVAYSLRDRIDGYNIFTIMIIFGIVILVFATFVSHTVATLIIVPLVKEVGELLSDPRPQVLVMASALLASAAMALPTSGFPNVTAVGLLDEKGQRYVQHTIFISRGLPASLICFLVIISLGYGIMTLIGF